MPYSPAIVANAVLYRAKQHGVFVNHLKLQKFVFFTHVWSLAILDVPAVEERPEAWEHGPVFGSLFYRLKDIGHQAIDAYIETIDAETNSYQALVPPSEDSNFWHVLEQVIEQYGRFTATELSALGHVHGGPWEQARNSKLAFIPDDSICTFYREMLQ